MRVYPEYKDSGVEWLGEIPSHWGSTAIKRKYDVTLGKMLCNEARTPMDTHEAYLKAGSIQAYGVNTKNLPKMWFSPKERKNLLLVCGDLVISEGGDAGRCAIWKGEVSPCYIQNSVNRARSSNLFSTKYLYYWMQLIKSNGLIDIICNKSTIAHYTAEKLEATECLHPYEIEQKFIVQFLDRETARIDKLISEKQNFIKLLKEKRQALISHVVTKGLDPHVKMKDSGIEWIGEVPEHWGVVPLKRMLRFVEQGWSPDCHANPVTSDKWGVLKAGAVNGGVYRETENKELPDTLIPRPEIEVKQGDLLMSRASGSKELIGSIAYVCKTRPKIMFSDKLFRLNCIANVDAQYLCVVLGSYPLRRQIELSIGGAEGLANNLSQANIKKLLVPFPPIDEQISIFEHVSEYMSKIDIIALEMENSLTFLKEHRTALISAAVTGKIDVRDHAQ